MSEHILLKGWLWVYIISCMFGIHPSLATGRSSINVGGWRGTTLIELRCCPSDGGPLWTMHYCLLSTFCVLDSGPSTGLQKCWAPGPLLKEVPVCWGSRAPASASQCHAVGTMQWGTAGVLAAWGGEALLGELPGGSDPRADYGRTSMNHFNVFNKGVRKEESGEKATEAWSHVQLLSLG